MLFGYIFLIQILKLWCCIGL